VQPKASTMQDHKDDPQTWLKGVLIVRIQTQDVKLQGIQSVWSCDLYLTVNETFVLYSY